MFPARVRDRHIAADCVRRARPTPATRNRRRTALSLALIGLGLTACGTANAPSSPATGRSASRPDTSTGSRTTGVPRAASTSLPSKSTPSASQSAPSSTPRASFDLGYQPLYPFADLSQARSWQEANRVGGHQPWHLEAGATALSFARGWLGFQELDTVTSTVYDSNGAHIGVGYALPTTGQLATAAVMHLVRFGTDLDSPWEVVGSDDDLTSFSIEQPTYGSAVSSPMTVGGHITGVDENIKVTVRQLTSEAAVGQKCCQPAGPVDPPDPWGTSVAFTGSGVLTIVASTGGHLHQVERFAIQGVHT